MKAILTALVVAVINTGTFAQSGILDVKFGNSGIVQTPITGFPVATEPSGITKVIQQPDGKILVVGWANNPPSNDIYFAMARYHIEGAPDISFGNNGFVVDFDMPGKGSDVVLQSTGKIVVATSNYLSSGLPYLARYHANGKLDTSFATKGRKILSANQIMRLPNDGLLALSNASSSYMLTALKENGSPDSSYGVNGRITNMTAATVLPVCTLQPDGKVLVAMNKADSVVMYRHDTNGSIDAQFGTGGRQSFFYGYPTSQTLFLAVQSDGKIMVGGGRRDGTTVTTSGLGLMRLQTNGMIDSSFGSFGSTSYSLGFHAQASGLHILPNGCVVLTGMISSAYVYGKSYLALVKYMPDGKPDAMFGKKGAVIAQLQEGDEHQSLSSVIQQDGKILIGGSMAAPNAHRFMLVRFVQEPAQYYNRLFATVFVDRNNDGIKNDGEENLQYARVRVTHNGNSFFKTSSTGAFTFEVDTGTFVLSAIAPLPYYTISPALDTSHFGSYFLSDTVNFALSRISGFSDVAVNFAPVSPLRPGFGCKYTLNVVNTGTDTAVALNVKFKKDYRLQLDSASATPMVSGADTLVFNIDSLLPNKHTTINLHFLLLPSPSSKIGDTLLTSATVSGLGADCHPANNIASHRGVVTSSASGISKSEGHGGKLSMDEYNSGEYLQYVIRFQNTGSDTVFNAYITDTLDGRLDNSTVEIVASSHDHQLLVSGNNLKFVFCGIRLPDSSVNQSGSHGFVVFRVKPKPGLTVNTIFSNKAFIYFDNNLPTISRVEYTWLVGQVLPVKLLSFEVRRSGEANFLEWLTGIEISTTRFEIERSSNGIEFIGIGTVAAGLFKHSFSDEEPLTGRNFYRLRIVDNDGKHSYSPVRVVEVSKEMQVKVYPNPATGKVTLQVESLKATTATIRILGTSGRVVKMHDLQLQKGFNQFDILLEELTRGIYLVKLSTQDEVMLVKLVIN